MKLLVVTGIVNSSWLPTYSALRSAMKKLADAAPDYIDIFQPLVKQKKTITESTLSGALSLPDDNSDYVFCDKKQFLNLSQWALLPQIKMLVFYSNPATTLANALSQQELSLNECNELMAEWANQIGDTFRFYQQHKDSCLLLDIDDVNKHSELASESISGFVEQEIRLGNVATKVSTDALVAANLLLSEQDHLFEAYDEVRSSAPIFGNFILSGTADYQSLAIDSLKSININRKATIELNEQLSELEDKKSSLSEEVGQLTKQLRESQGNNQEQATQLSQAQETLQASDAKIVASQTALEEANKKHHEESAKLQNKIRLGDEQSLQFKKTHCDLESENGLLVLQIAQRQEELEVTFEKKSLELGEIKETLKASYAELESSKRTLADANEKHQADILVLTQEINKYADDASAVKKTQENWQSGSMVLVAKNGQLQTELDAQKEIFTAFSSKTEALNQKSQFDKKNDEKKKADLVNELVQVTEENELCVLQISQLQEELEAHYQSKHELEKKHRQELEQQQRGQTQLLDKGSQVQQEMQATLAEHEIATLQINQLQEELEFYYQQLQERESQTLLTQLTNDQPCQNVFEQTTIESFDIVSAYEIEGYQDIRLLLNNVKFANGNCLEKLHVKLVEISGKPGIEFRPSEATDESVNLHWREDMQDEYGSFIRFIPNPNSEQFALQQKTNESLCASDRLIVLSIANKLADVLQMTTDSDLPEGKLRDWKLIAITLKHQVAQLPNWMSFDALSLVEEMRTDNYEHLWLRFNNLLVNNHLRPEFEVKFAVTDLTSEGELFSNNIMLEIRQQDNQHPPLQAWPPISQDEYGPKLEVFVDLTEDELNIRVEEKLSDSDYQFLRHLVKNLANFLQVLTNQGVSLERSLQDWLALGNRIEQIGQTNPEQTKDLDLISEPDDAVTLELDVTFNEHVDLGGYQHLLFQQLLSDNEPLLIKIRAENINQEAKTAELFLELRTGNENVPLADSEFFGEDEFGPRVLLPLAYLQNDKFKQQMNLPEVKLLASFDEKITGLIESNAELDEYQRALWLAMLTNK